MPNFVKGQLVKCITIPSDHELRLKVDTVYKVKKSWYDNGNFIQLENNNYHTYDTTEVMFRTIIYSIDDVVKGMELTLIQNGCKYKVVEKDASHQNVFICGWYNINEFKEFINKENEIEYEVIKAFNIVDIYKSGVKSCAEFIVEYEKLINSISTNTLGNFFTTIDQIKNNAVLNDHLDYLEEKWFIKKINKDILKVGMRLKNQKDTFTLIKLTGRVMLDKMYFLYIPPSDAPLDTFKLLPNSEGGVFSIPIKNTTLQDLNHIWHEHYSTIWTIAK